MWETDMYTGSNGKNKARNPVLGMEQDIEKGFPEEVR